MKEPAQAPVSRGATLDWAWDWGDWLLPGDAIASHVITLSDGLTKVSSTAAGPVVTAVLTCAEDAPIGARLRAMCTIATTGGLSDARSILLTVSQR